MALNKAQTSAGMKVVLIILIVAFVASFIPLFGASFSGDSKTNQPGALDAINQQYQPTVQSLTTILQSEPESYTVLVNLGNTYFDWASALQQHAQTNPAAQGADQPIWVASKDAYRRAIAVKDGDPPVVVDYAITLYYTGETNEAIASAERIAESTPDFAPAFFNLGIFYQALGETRKALAAFQEYLKLDPKGARGDAEFAKQKIQELGGSVTTGTSTPATGAP